MHYWLETAYFATRDPVLAIVAGFGLWQLVLAIALLGRLARENRIGYRRQATDEVASVVRALSADTRMPLVDNTMPTRAPPAMKASRQSDSPDYSRSTSICHSELLVWLRVDSEMVSKPCPIGETNEVESQLRPIHRMEEHPGTISTPIGKSGLPSGPLAVSG